MKYPHCKIISSEMLVRILKDKGGGSEAQLLRDIIVSERIRAKREIIGSLQGIFPAGGSYKQIQIFDADHSDDTMIAKPVRKVGDAPVEDKAVNEVFDSLDTTYNLYLDVYNRKSVDNNNLPLNAYVHWLYQLNNAFWDGKEMCYGDGDQSTFVSFTSAIDIGGH